MKNRPAASLAPYKGGNVIGFPCATGRPALPSVGGHRPAQRRVSGWPRRHRRSDHRRPGAAAPAHPLASVVVGSVGAHAIDLLRSRNCNRTMGGFPTLMRKQAASPMQEDLCRQRRCKPIFHVMGVETTGKVLVRKRRFHPKTHSILAGVTACTNLVCNSPTCPRNSARVRRAVCMADRPPACGCALRSGPTSPGRLTSPWRTHMLRARGSRHA
jgi:hypothetical protein